MTDERIHCKTCGYLRKASEIDGERCKYCKNEDAEENSTLTKPGLGGLVQAASVEQGRQF